MSVLLVRHGKAGNRETWQGPDEERPLTAAGRRQAEALVHVLSGVRVAKVLSSHYLRCRQTVEPLAQARKLKIKNADALVEGSAIDDALQLITSLDDAVLCSHADVIAGVVLELRNRKVRMHGGTQWDKGSTWALTVRRGVVVEGRYLPPPDD